MARQLGLGGWVKNMPDGSVEMEAVGSSSQVEQLLAWCRSGPPNAKVSELQVQSRQELSQNPYDDFEIH